jgi:hypothetical protein
MIKAVKAIPRSEHAKESLYLGEYPSRFADPTMTYQGRQVGVRMIESCQIASITRPDDR